MSSDGGKELGEKEERRKQRKEMYELSSVVISFYL